MPTSYKARILIGIVVFAAALTFALWENQTPLVSTVNNSNAAKIPLKMKAHHIPIQSEIHGKISQIHIKNNQIVQRGDVLLQLDPEYYVISLEQAKAQLSKAQRQSKTDAMAVQAAQILLAQREAELAQQEALLIRKNALAQKGYFPKQQLLEASTQVAAAKAAVMMAKMQLEKAQFMADPTQSDPLLAKAIADFKKAEINLNRTKIKAPVDGMIVDMELYVDQVISAHEPLLILEPSKAAMQANRKLTPTKVLYKSEMLQKNTAITQ